MLSNTFLLFLHYTKQNIFIDILTYKYLKLIQKLYKF